MKRVSLTRMACLTGLASCMVFGATASGAQQLSDEFRIVDGGGKVRYDRKILETSAKPEPISPHFVTVKGVTPIFDPAQYGHFIALFDQGPVIRISDVVGIYATKTPTGTVLHLAFASDNEQMSPPLTKWIAPGVPPPPPIPESGPIDVTRFLNPALQANHWTALFTSDVPLSTPGGGPAAVPEPGLWSMMVAGAAGIGLALRTARRQRPRPAGA